MCCFLEIYRVLLGNLSCKSSPLVPEMKNKYLKRELYYYTAEIIFSNVTLKNISTDALKAQLHLDFT